MRTRNLLAASVLAAFCGAALAEDAHHPADAAKPAAPMQRMQEQMKKIQAASDPKERQRLVEEHMKTMQEAMPMMTGMQGCMGMTPHK